MGWWIFFIVGLLVLLSSLIGIFKKKVIAGELILMIWLAIPAASLILLKPYLYDDGRHFYFMYPPMIFIAAIGLKWLFSSNSRQGKNSRIFMKLGSGTVLIATFVYLAWFIVRYHPFQQTYFNMIGRQYAEKDFEKDYWGLSYRNALEYLVANDKSAEIKLCWTMAPCEYNLIWLKKEDQKRIH
jgi:hypothetical protein